MTGKYFFNIERFEGDRFEVNREVSGAEVVSAVERLQALIR